LVIIKKILRFNLKFFNFKNFTSNLLKASNQIFSNIPKLNLLSNITFILDLMFCLIFLKNVRECINLIQEIKKNKAENSKIE
jgi:hypothetical protein